MYGYIRCMGTLSACEYSQAKLPEQSLSAQKFITLDSNVSVPNEVKVFLTNHKTLNIRLSTSGKRSAENPHL